MNKKYLAIALCTLAVTACSDRGEVDENVIVNEQVLGNNSTLDGILGEMDTSDASTTLEDTVDGTDADTTAAPDENSGSVTDDTDTITDPSTGPDGSVSADDTSTDTEAGTEDTDSQTSGTGDDSVADTPIADIPAEDVPVVTTGTQVILPSDCSVETGSDGRGYCISASTGNRLFALNADDTLRWTTILPDSNSDSAPVIVPGDELFLIRSDGSGAAALTSLDNGGNIRYEALLTGDFNTIVEGVFEQPNLFLHVKNSAGNSSILQIDAATGRQNRVRDFAGHNLTDFAVEEFNANRVLAVTLNGVVNYLTQDELIDFNRIFSLDPSNFGERFPTHVENLRGSYTGEFISLLRNAVNLVDVTSAETEVACSAGGSINLLPENSFISDQQFTRAYEFSDCDIEGTISNGTLIHSLFEIDTIAGRNGSESLQMDNLSLTKENTSGEGAVFVEEKALSATIKNVYVFNGGELSAERVLEVNNYSHTFDDANVLSIAGASYTRVIDTQGEDSPADGFRLTESGSMRSVTDRDSTVVVEIIRPLVYLNSDSPVSVSTLDDAPLSGMVDLQAADSSTLSVDASRAGVNQQNYTLTQRGTEITIDDIWMVAPVNTGLSILN